MKLLSVFAVCLWFGLSSAPSLAEVRLTKDEVAHFVVVLEDLQHQMAATAQDLSSPTRVRDFRELAEVLRLHQTVMRQAGASGEGGSFVRYLNETGWWTNRNLGIADRGEFGESHFERMFTVLRQNSDVAISGNRALQAVLISASERIEGASGFEAMSVPVEPPETALLSEAELEAAVAMAAMGVVRLPFTLYGTGERASFDYYLPGRARALVFCLDFLQRREVVQVLRRRSITSLHAAVAMGAADSGVIRDSLPKMVTLLGSAETRENRQKFTIQAARLVGEVGNLLEQVEGEFPPSQAVAAQPGGLGAADGTVEVPPAVKGAFTLAEAQVLLSLLGSSLDELPPLVDLVEWDRFVHTEPAPRALLNSSFSLSKLLDMLKQDEHSNHLTGLLHQAGHFQFRNYLSMASADGKPESKLTALYKAVARRDRPQVDELLRSLSAIDMLESLPGVAPEPEVRPRVSPTVSPSELYYTEGFVMQYLVHALHSLVVAPKLDQGNEYSAEVMEVRVERLEKAFLLLLARRESFAKSLAAKEREGEKARDYFQYQSAKSLVANAVPALQQLAKLRHAFAQLAALDAGQGGTPTLPLSVAKSALYELLANAKIVDVGGAGGAGCPGDLLEAAGGSGLESLE